MGRRFAVLVTLCLVVLSAASGPAGASDIQDKIARHRAEIRARIAARHASDGPRAPRSARLGGRPAAASTPSSGTALRAPTQGRLIEIVKGSQRLIAWQGGRAVLSTHVSTGAPGHVTPSGRFSILSKERMHWSNQYHVYMPYAMRVVGGIFIHELPITRDGRRIGSAAIGSPASHGCIRVPTGTAARLFNWATVGTPVLIH